jgi:hypothetical protein
MTPDVQMPPSKRLRANQRLALSIKLGPSRVGAAATAASIVAVGAHVERLFFFGARDA